MLYILVKYRAYYKNEILKKTSKTYLYTCKTVTYKY